MFLRSICSSGHVNKIFATSNQNVLTQSTKEIKKIELCSKKPPNCSSEWVHSAARENDKDLWIKSEGKELDIADEKNFLTENILVYSQQIWQFQAKPISVNFQKNAISSFWNNLSPQSFIPDT